MRARTLDICITFCIFEECCPPAMSTLHSCTEWHKERDSLHSRLLGASLPKGGTWSCTEAFGGYGSSAGI